MYKPREFYKKLLAGYNLLNNATSNRTACKEAVKPLQIEKVLLVSKLTHYEFERRRANDCSDSELEMRIRNRGTDYDKLLHYHHLHKGFEKNVTTILKNTGIEVRVVNRYNYTDDAIEWADVVMPTGGDGTFLYAASRIRDNRKVVIGFNSDPSRSEGHLCLPKKFSTDIRLAIERLLAGDYKWLLRSRIRTTLTCHKNDITPRHLHEAHGFELRPDDKISSGQVLPYLALNEVFMGETLSARVSHLGMWMNGDEQKTNIKSSGVCISTGTGSTSWHLSINRLPTQSVAELLRFLDMDPTEGKDSLATVLARMYNENLVFNPDDKRMGYTIRDLISAGVWPQPKGIKSRGFAEKVKVQSNCMDACLVIDGGISLPFNDGSYAILEIVDEDALRTVTLPERV